MQRVVSFLVLIAIAAALTSPAAAQTGGQSGSVGNVDRSGSAKNPNQPPERTWGDYRFQGSFEVGYRFVDVTSKSWGLTRFEPTSAQTYNTFVDLQEGPRFLEQTFSLRSPNNTGVLFDNLYINSFGWGGDPENVARLRANKNKVYNFNILFRRDRNFFDYPLLANPLNPPTVAAPFTVTFSPHRYENTRRMTDVNLTLAPQSPIGLRLGYARVRQEGDSFLTIHEGTDPLLFQPTNTTNDSYQIGVDLKVLPRTVIAYDQYLLWFKYDTKQVLTNSTPLPFANGAIGQFGLPIFNDPPFPCNAGQALVVGGFANPTCNVYFSYNRDNRYRTFSPTEQLSFQSNYIKNLDLNGRVLYTNATTDGRFTDFFNGFVARLRERQFADDGPHRATRNAVTADLGVTLHLTDHLRISDTFRFYRWSIPSSFFQTETFFAIPGTGATGTGCPAATCNSLVPVAALAPTTEQLNFFWTQKENTKSNQIELEIDTSRFFGGHIGYRFRNRAIRSGLFEVEALTDEELDEAANIAKDQNIDVDEHTGLAGIWFRPSDNFRFSVDAELLSATNYVTRISPRQAQEVRARAQYTPKHNLTFALYGLVWEARNGQSDINYRGHNRNYGVNFTIAPNERWMFDLSYNYGDQLQNAFICFNSTFLPTGSLACGALNFATAPGNGSNPNRVYSRYESVNHFGTAILQITPVKRVTTTLGYSIVANNGATTILNSRMPFGPLMSNYHRPLASVEIEVVRGLALKGAWNYFGYNEKTDTLATTPRDFHANVETVSLKYSF